MRLSLLLAAFATAAILLAAAPGCEAAKKREFYKWFKGRATWYGQPSGAGTTAGACGYGNTYQRGYNLNTAAASSTLWGKGLGCGACYQVKCRSHSTCKNNYVIVTVTNNCPNNWALSPDHGGWCNPPNRHLDMTNYAFSQIANPQAGVVPTSMRRVPCQRNGNVIFSMYGNPWFMMILVTNVGGSGDLAAVSIRTDGGKWKAAWQNYGAIWTVDGGGFTGKSVHFKLKSGFTKEKLVIPNALPSNWGFGGDYQSGRNFRVSSDAGSKINSWR